MRVGIDATRLQTGGAGYFRYLEKILKELPGCLAGDEHLFVYAGRNVPRNFISGKNVALRRTLLKPKHSNIRTIWEHFVLPYRIYKNRAEIIHSTYYLAPNVTVTPVILTVPGLLFLTKPELFQKREVGNLTRFFSKSVSKAAALIVPSNSIKIALTKAIKIPDEKITVIPYGVDPVLFEYKNKDGRKETREKYILPRKYILFHGELSKPNNIKNIIDAFFVVRVTKKIDHDLVLISGGDAVPTYLEKQIGALNVRDAVRIISGVQDDELPAIYSGADAFICPAFGGGCQSEILQAMASKVPVITSNSPELDEAAGKTASIRLDPANLPGLRLALEKILLNRKEHNEQSEKGFEHAKKAPLWKDAAAQTLDLYRKVFVSSYSEEYRKS